MKVYYFRPDAVFLYEQEINSPVCPSNATTVALPPMGEGDYATFNFRTQSWLVQPGPAPQYPPQSEIDLEQQAANKAQAESLLQQTDWTATVDINNPTYSNPYLGNQDAFLAYRSQVRQIAVNPPTTPATFPPMPEEVWLPA